MPSEQSGPAGDWLREGRALLIADGNKVTREQ
jgi:hypothetical protein